MSVLSLAYFEEEKLSQTGQKNQSIGEKSFNSYGLEHEKTVSVTYLLKCS